MAATTHVAKGLQALVHLRQDAGVHSSWLRQVCSSPVSDELSSDAALVTHRLGTTLC